MAVRGVSLPNPLQLMQALFVLRGANMAITTDQPFTKMFNGSKWDPLFIVFEWASGAFNTACAGGIFTGANKTGSAIVAVGQSYAGLTGAATHVQAVIQASAVSFTVTPILSLTTGNSAALTADVFIIGQCYDPY
jgi:hypothetical protein